MLKRSVVSCVPQENMLPPSSSSCVMDEPSLPRLPYLLVYDGKVVARGPPFLRITHHCQLLPDGTHLSVFSSTATAGYQLIFPHTRFGAACVW